MQIANQQSPINQLAIVNGQLANQQSAVGNRQ
jgi:hypothetical protein